MGFVSGFLCCAQFPFYWALVPARMSTETRPIALTRREQCCARPAGHSGSDRVRGYANVRLQNCGYAERLDAQGLGVWVTAVTAATAATARLRSLVMHDLTHDYPREQGQGKRRQHHHCADLQKRHKAHVFALAANCVEPKDRGERTRDRQIRTQVDTD